MSLLRDIQNAAIEGSSDLETLLRKCRVLASRLRHDDLKRWVQFELDGYPDRDSVPDYRTVYCQATGNFFGAYGRELRNAPIPDACIPEEYREQLTVVRFQEGVGALRDLISGDDSGTLRQDWPSNCYLLFGGKIYRDMNLMEAWRTIPRNTFVGILSTVRNRILNFVLEIEAANPDAGEALPNVTPIPSEKVTQIFNTQVYGNLGNMTSGYQIAQHSTLNVIAGDFDSLSQFLISKGFNDSDIQLLGEALRAEKQQGSTGFGPKVAKWLGQAVTKVAEGGLKLSVDVASNVLTQALKAYFGV